MKHPIIERAIVAIAVVSVSAVAGAAADPQVFGYEEWKRAIAELPLNPQEVVYPFHASSEMVTWAAEKLSPYPSVSPELKLKALQLAFFHPGEFEFAYEQTRTLTAEEAFSARHGNCMSFTSLFVSLARAMDLPAFLMTVRRQPEVERDGGLVVVNRHVVAGFRSPNKIYTYDFYITSTQPYLSRFVIDDLMASAIYHTNIGGLFIREDNLDGALRNLEIATILAPDWAPAWVNLGVVQLRLGELEAAVDSLQQALVVEPGNSSALVTLSKIYAEEGRDEEAETAMRAAAEGTRNPFTLIAMADVEMMRGNYDEARKYLRRARWWYSKEPEVFDALARLARFQEDQEKLKKYRTRAGELRKQQAEEEAASPN
jgi:tetratricopeptide (TPR) repeat protein